MYNECNIMANVYRVLKIEFVSATLLFTNPKKSRHHLKVKNRKRKERKQE